MHLDRLQRRALDAMGIQVWESVAAPAADVPAVEPAGAPAPAGTDARQAPVAARSGAARQAAGAWEALEAEVRHCTRCALAASRTQTVFGVGNRDADWMVIGEAPGAEEDRQGEPFVGRAGQLLNQMLRAVGQSREQVYIANILKCRPPNNRDPKPEEIAACRDYLQRQIELVSPQLLLAVGRIAAQALLQTDAPVGRLRGRVHRLAPGGLPLVVTYHPAYLLRSPAQKRKAWEDLRLARSLLR
ncbi:MAG: uracil-DNA glycosylase [Gammaproteobacteria bacterium]|nr:MAG: uracil-DNA glycosylase [Gammaproteobacteria bacterium]